MGEEDCCSTQLINGNGQFKVAGVDKFVKFAELGFSYAVVTIMAHKAVVCFADYYSQLSLLQLINLVEISARV